MEVDEPPDLDNLGTGIVTTLEKPNNSQLKTKTIFEKFKECPLLYKSCIGKDTTCIGDINKFRGCNIFLEKYLTAPPKNYDFFSNGK